MVPLNTKTIEEVSETLIDYRGKTPQKTTNGVKLITAKVIKDGFIVDGNHEYIAESNYEAWMRRGLPQQWDILITTEAPLGEVAQIRTNERVALAQRVILLRGKTNIIDQGYYFQALKSPFVQGELKSRSSGTTVLGIKQSELRLVRVPYYPLPTQRKIASILSAYDDLIENNMRRIKILEEMAQALYREWFMKFRFPGHEKVRMMESELGMVPEGWEEVTIRDVSSYINRGISPKYDDLSRQIVINQKCIRDGRFNLNLVRRHSTKVPVEKFVKFGDVLINSTGIGTLGRVAQICQEISDCTVDSHVSIVRPNDRVSHEYFGSYLATLEPHFDSQGIGSTGQTELGRETIAKTIFLLPPKGLQDRFAEIVSPMRKNVVKMFIKNINLRRTRDLLLPKLILGEINIE